MQLHWRHLKPLAALALLIAGLPCLAVPAAEADDRQIVADLVAGRYDKLISLEALARRGDPTAMHWWGVLLEACAIDRCRREEADSWWRKAAQAGNSRSRALVYLRSGHAATPQDPYIGIGEPRTAEEKLFWATAILGALGIDRSLGARALAALEEVHDAEPTMRSMHLNMIFGRGDQIAAARAMLGAGTPYEHLVGETLRRQYLLRERKRYPELLAMAQANDAVAAVALCASTDVMEGDFELPPALYPLCVAAFERGHLGLANVLLKHHLERREMEAAARYARWCASLPVSCADGLSEYEKRRLGVSQAWRDRDAELAVGGSHAASDDMPVSVRRRGLSMKVRRVEAQQACMRRAHLPDRGTFAEAAECLWGKPPS